MFRFTLPSRRRFVFGPVLVTLATVALVATSGAPVQAAPYAGKVPRWQARLDAWKVRRATAPGNFSAFNRERIFGEIAAGRMKALLFDGQPQGLAMDDPRSKFVVIRSRNAFRRRRDVAGEHVLAIPTPRPASNGPPGGSQPVHLHDVDRGKAHHLGRMLRGVLTSVEQLHLRAASGRYSGWVADIHLPDSLTMPVLHVHGQFSATLRGAFKQAGEPPQVRSWGRTLADSGYRRTTPAAGGYELYAAGAAGRLGDWDVVAVARPSMKRYLAGDRELDGLVGRMVLDAAALAVARNTRAGYIVIERDERQVVAKVVARSRRRATLRSSLPIDAPASFH